jgi:hypothetical protein
MNEDDSPSTESLLALLDGLEDAVANLPVEPIRIIEPFVPPVAPTRNVVVRPSAIAAAPAPAPAHDLGCHAVVVAVTTCSRDDTTAHRRSAASCRGSAALQPDRSPLETYPRSSADIARLFCHA